MKFLQGLAAQFRNAEDNFQDEDGSVFPRMAQKVKIVLEDDLDGGPSDETVRFGLDDAQYEIDLTNDNAAKLREALRPYAVVLRRATMKNCRGADHTTSSPQRRNPETQKVPRLGPSQRLQRL